MIPNDYGMHPTRLRITIEDGIIPIDDIKTFADILGSTKLMFPSLVINPSLCVKLDPVKNNLLETSEVYLKRIGRLFNGNVVKFEVFDKIDGYIPVRIYASHIFGRTTKWPKLINAVFCAYITSINRSNEYRTKQK